MIAPQTSLGHSANIQLWMSSKYVYPREQTSLNLLNNPPLLPTVIHKLEGAYKNDTKEGAR